MGGRYKKTKPHDKVFVRSFSGATTQRMGDYVNLSIGHTQTISFFMSGGMKSFQTGP